MVKNIATNFQQEDVLYLTCDDPNVRTEFRSYDIKRLKQKFENYKIVILDEAQQIVDIELLLKLLIDSSIKTQFLVTGSSSFDLANKTESALTGRKYEFILYPLSVTEIIENFSLDEAKINLDKMLRFGLYPEIYTNKKDRQKELLNELKSGYLFKDIFMHENIKNPEVLHKLVELLALQIGSEVSLNELANNIGIDKKTVTRYLELLEKIFLIYRFRPFSRNLRKELNKKRKIYFYDTGLRNAIIQNFNRLDLRNDVGVLWEQFCITERIKYLSNRRIFANHYFWRTWDQKEIDLIEERDDVLYGYEIKWKKNKHLKAPRDWIDNYKNAKFEIITKENFFDWIT